MANQSGKKDVVISACLFGATLGAVVGCLFWVSMGIDFQGNGLLFGCLFISWVIFCAALSGQLGAKYWRVLQVEPSAHNISRELGKRNFIA